MTFMRAMLGITFISLVLSGGALHAAPSCIAGVNCSYTKDTGANSGKTDSLGCDGDFMNQIYARASLEVQREMVQNQSLIRKGDSVLEYTCFDRMANTAANEGGDIFSNGNAYSADSVSLNIVNLTIVTLPAVVLAVNMTGSHIDDAMDAVVVDTVNDYLGGNFDHNYLGGAASSSFSPSGSSSYACSEMQEVYNLARCTNLGDPFYTFSELVSTDPRDNNPVACGGTNPTNITADTINVSLNAANAYMYAVFDAVSAYSDMFEIDSAASDLCPTPPLPMGLRATYYVSDKVTPVLATNPTGLVMSNVIYEEKICTNPGCWYDATTNDCRP